MFDRALEGIPHQPSSISIEEFRDRQERVLSRLSHSDFLIIASPKEKTRSNDVHYPFRTQSDLLYLCGWKDPESVLTCHHDGDNWITTLFVQPKNTLMEIWEGRRLGLEGAKKLFAIDESYSIDDLEDILNLYDIDVRILGEEYRNKEFTGKDICQKKSIELFFNQRDHRFSTSGLRKSCAWVNRDGDWKMTAEG